MIRNQARAVAAAAGPMAKSPAGARLIMAAMDQHLSAMQGQLQTTKTHNQAVTATLRQTAAGYQTLSDGAMDSPTDPTIRAAGWKPGDPLPASPAPPGLPPVATDPRNPFIGDPRFGYWTDYVAPPYTGSAPPPPAKQHVPWVDGPEGGPTGFYTRGRTWIGDNDAPFASYQQQYKFRIAGEDLTSYTQVGPGGQMQRWVAYTYEAQEFQNVALNGNIWAKTPADASQGTLGGVATGGIGGISIPPTIGPWQPITPGPDRHPVGGQPDRQVLHARSVRATIHICQRDSYRGECAGSDHAEHHRWPARLTMRKTASAGRPPAFCASPSRRSLISSLCIAPIVRTRAPIQTSPPHLS